MDRSELIDALSGDVDGIPTVKSIERLELNPDDALVLTLPGHITEELAIRIRETMERHFPGRKVLILTDGLELKVLRKA